MKNGDPINVSITAGNFRAEGIGGYLHLQPATPVEIYEGELEMIAHQAMEVLAKKYSLKYNNDPCNALYLQQISDALLTTLKRHNSQIEISVRRKNINTNPAP